MTRGLRIERASDPRLLGDPTLTLTMTRCLERLRQHGALQRLPGGFWVRPGCGFRGNTPAESWDGATTVEALVRRGFAEYSKWQTGRGGKAYPIEARPRP